MPTVYQMRLPAQGTSYSLTSSPSGIGAASVALGGGWLANLPSGLTEQYDIDFSTASDISYGGERATSAAQYDGSSLSPPISPNDVARMVLPAGTMGAQGGFSLGSKSLTVPTGTVRVYIAAAVYFSSDYVWHTGNHKFFYFWRHITDGSSGSVVLGIDPTRGTGGSTTGKAFLNADPQYYVGGQPVFESSNSGQGGQTGEVTRSAWHYIEMETVLETSFGATDGILRVWLDDVLQLERTDVTWSDNSSWMEWRRTNFDPYYGGQNASHTVSTETYHYVDQLYVATSTSRS